MKKLFLMGRSEAGKTSLTQALKGEELHYEKTQYTITADDTIDSPGEYAESKQFGAGLACFSFEADVVGIVQAADAISAARPGARRETLETYTNRLKQLEDITNSFKGVEKSFAIQAGREVRIMVVPEQVSDSEMVLLARDISKQIEAELEYPGQIKVNVIRESRVTDYAK